MTVARLQDHGLSELDDESIRAFLSSESMGVLGLSAGDIPYLLPMSYEFDGESALYFTFVGGPESRKRQRVERTGEAGFLVYDARTPFNWESVLVTGSVESVPCGEWDRFVAETAWRPEVIEAAMGTEAVTVYRLQVEAWTGYRYTGLPSGFEGGDDANT